MHGNDTENERAKSAREVALRKRLRDDLSFYAPRCLAVLSKPDEKGSRNLQPLRMNAAQRMIHDAIERQRADTGMVRALILKGRQQGASTYVEARNYWITTNRRGQRTMILTHVQDATDNLFAMVERYHANAPVYVKPRVGTSNAKELAFPDLDSRFQVSTAGARGVGRSATLTVFHGSEVAFWPNANDHLAGALQAVPYAPGTEVVLESTANGVGNTFHEQWVRAESGSSDFIAIFVPWFVSPEYVRTPPDGWVASSAIEDVPEGEQSDAEYQAAFKLTDAQMYWRSRKIVELGGGEPGFYLFKQEYPATADEAFQASTVGNTLLKRRDVLRARKSTVATPGALVIGVDPGGEGEGGDPTAIIRRRTRKLFDPQQFTKLTHPQLVAMLHRIIKRERPSRMFIDVGGLGAGLVSSLLELPGTQGTVVGVNFGEAATDPELYANRRAEMAWSLDEWLREPGGANIPDDDMIQREFLASVIAPPRANGQRLLRSKEWMRSKGIPSPNLFDAACLTFAMPVRDEDGERVHSAGDFDPLGPSAWGADAGGNSGTVDFDPLEY